MKLVKKTYLVTYEAHLHILLGKFRKKKSFDLAQFIWLFCHDHKFEVPKDVFEEFIQGIRKRSETYRTKVIDGFFKQHDKQAIKALSTDFIDNLLKSGKCKNGAEAIREYIKFHKELYDEIITEDLVRQNYYRMGGKLVGKNKKLK